MPLDHPEVLPPEPPLPTGATPHQLASRGFAQMFGFHPAVASLTIAVDLMIWFGDVATAGLAIPVGIAASVPVGVITYLAQKKWYGDDKESALIKALIAGLLTAIPAPLSPILIPSAIVGLLRRKKD